MKTYIVGRSDSADIQIEDSSVSGQHLSIRSQSGRWQVTDLNSTNGTFIINAGGKIEIKEEFLEGSEQLMIGNCRVALADLTAAIPAQPETDSQGDKGRQSSADSGFSRYIRTEDGRYERKTK